MEETKNCNNCAFLVDEENDSYRCALSGEVIHENDLENESPCDEWESILDYPGEDDIFTEYDLEDDEDQDD